MPFAELTDTHDRFTELFGTKRGSDRPDEEPVATASRTLPIPPVSARQWLKNPKNWLVALFSLPVLSYLAYALVLAWPTH